jgi:DNA polymerase III subunit epsilon
VVFDLETTGLNPERHEIIEIGAIKVNRDSDVHQTFQALVKPVKRIPKKITEITGITQAMVTEDGEPAEQVLRDFHEFYRGSSSCEWIMARDGPGHRRE